MRNLRARGARTPPGPSLGPQRTCSQTGNEPVRRTPVGLRLRGPSSPFVEPAPVCADTKHGGPAARSCSWMAGGYSGALALAPRRRRNHRGLCRSHNTGGRGHLPVGCRSARSCRSSGRPQTHCLLVLTRVSNVARPRCQTSACARAACRRRSGGPWLTQACRLGACGRRDRRDRFRRPGVWHGAIAIATLRWRASGRVHAAPDDRLL